MPYCLIFRSKSENYCQVPQILGGEGQGGGRGGGAKAVGAVKPALSKVRPNDSSWKIYFDFAFLLGKNGQTLSTFSCQPLEWRLALAIFGGEFPS